MRRPPAIRALLAIILGALTTLAVAIACGLLLDPPYGRGHVALDRAFVMNGRPWSVTEWSRAGTTVSMWSEITRDYFTLPPPPGSPAALAPRTREDAAVLLHDFLADQDATLASGRARPMPRSDSPGPWGRFATGHAPASLPDTDFAAGKYIHGDDFGYGWPCIALWFGSTGWTQGNRGSTTEHAGAILVSGQPIVVMNARCRVVPYFPAWRGLLIDTLFYAALWALLLSVPGPLRRAIRRRRGQCERCQYDRKGLAPGVPCPECGHAPVAPASSA